MRHPPHFAARHAAEDKPRISRRLPASEESKNKIGITNVQAPRQDRESRGTRLRDKAAAAAKAVIMKGDKSERQGSCSGKSFVNQDPQ